MRDYELIEENRQIRKQEVIAKMAGVMYGAAILAPEGDANLPGIVGLIHWSVITATRIYDKAGTTDCKSHDDIWAWAQNASYTPDVLITRVIELDDLKKYLGI